MNVFRNVCRVQLSWIIYKDDLLYEPDVCASPQRSRGNPQPQCDRIWRWGLWERTSYENEALVNEISALTKRLQGVPESLLPSRRWPSMTQHAALA